MWKKILNLEKLIYLTILALPTYLLRFRVLSFSVSTLDCLLLLCIAWWLIIYRKEHSGKLFFKKCKFFIFSGGVMLFGLFFSVLVNKNYVPGVGIFISWFLLPIFFSLVASSVISSEKRKNIFLAYYFSAFCVALISLVYYFFGFVTFDGRLQGFFNSPNYLAMCLAPAIFIGYGLFFELKKQKNIFLFSGASIVLVVYLTYSYASWIAIIISLGIVLALKREMSWKISLMGFLILVVLLFSQMTTSKFSALVSYDSRSSLASRLMIWHSAEKMLERHWIWGIGAGNFQEKYLENQKYFPPYLEWAVPHPHNLYLAFWLYGGIFGLIGFLMLVYFWFLNLFMVQKNPQLKLIGLGVMVYILLHGLVDTTYFKNDLAVVFWLLFSVI